MSSSQGRLTLEVFNTRRGILDDGDQLPDGDRFAGGHRTPAPRVHPPLPPPSLVKETQGPNSTENIVASVLA